MTKQDLRTIAAMRRYGGRFVRALGSAAMHAKDDNLARIKAAWPEYWQLYTDMAERAAEKEAQP